MSTYLTAVTPDDMHPDVDWSDQTSVHRAVMAMFADRAEGDPDAWRSANRILYRTETIPHEPGTAAGGRSNVHRVLIQSAVTPSAGATKQIDTHLDRISAGGHFRFRVLANTVSRQARTRKVLTVTADQIEGWLQARIPGAAVSVTEVDRVPLRFTRPDAKTAVPVVATMIDGECVVTNPDAFRDKIIHGVGRERSFGCGLLTVLPI